MDPSCNQVMLLQLAAAQLALSLQETEKPFNDLTKLFLEIVQHHRQIDDLLQQTPAPDIQLLHELHKQTEAKVKTSVMDFQFYDRMSQRLHHILSNLQQAILVLNDNESFQDENEWEKIFNKIEESYTMQEEKELYLAIKRGEGFETAVKNLISKTQQKDAIESDIELF
ncbi:hypothetical protein [Aliikangiella coralliicola]|uniref:Uncharacterized protein n=1 Tax=Aliikangiella coralliicola TaxID=2592383 RepID=A0A545U0C0_9GAMM|nr:hypothetical protein [Aliikangiella coralliicola]TQV82911.1 hypothetical protein FLL46_24380 [Aliikangiella coralliicola]